MCRWFECRLNAMQQSRNVTGAVIIISRVLLRELYHGEGRLKAMGLGMLLSFLSVLCNVANIMVDRIKRPACRSG